RRRNVNLLIISPLTAPASHAPQLHQCLAPGRHARAVWMVDSPPTPLSPQVLRLRWLPSSRLLGMRFTLSLQRKAGSGPAGDSSHLSDPHFSSPHLCDPSSLAPGRSPRTLASRGAKSLPLLATGESPRGPPTARLLLRATTPAASTARQRA